MRTPSATFSSFLQVLGCCVHLLGHSLQTSNPKSHGKSNISEPIVTHLTLKVSPQALCFNSEDGQLAHYLALHSGSTCLSPASVP